MTFRWALLAASGLVILGLFWDSAYHTRNPGFEAGWEMAKAHGVVWLGLLVGLVAGTLGAIAAPERRTVFLVAAGGALAGLLGHALDVVGHANGSRAGFAHALFILGQLVLVVAAVLASPRSLRLPGLRAQPDAGRRTSRSKPRR